LVGGPVGSIARTSIAFSRDGEQWAFIGASVFMGADDLQGLETTVAATIRKRLGKPRWTRQNTDRVLHSMGWALARNMELLLAPSSVEGEHLLMITVSEPTGP
jgi:hypothetical protein